MFRLMSFFSSGEKRNSFAPIIYKNLSFALIENHSDPGTREFILCNLS